MQYRNTTKTRATQEVLSTGRRFARRGFAVLAATALLVVSNVAANAQYVPAFEIRPMAGAYIPLGEQKNLVNSATMYGAQASWLMSPSWAFTGSLGWTRNEDRALAPAINRLDMLQYDAGLEARLSPSIGESWSFAPFLGLGAGARTYNYKDLDVDTQTYFAGYGAIGGELGYKAIGVRLEARDYLSRFRPGFDTGAMDYRNDLTLSAALNLRIW